MLEFSTLNFGRVLTSGYPEIPGSGINIFFECADALKSYRGQHTRFGIFRISLSGTFRVFEVKGQCAGLVVVCADLWWPF